VAVRTSQTHPLQIAEVRAMPEQGRIGITFCPGKHDRFALTGAWARDLELDLDVISAWGAKLVLTLVEPEELNQLKVPNLGEQVQRRGIEWRHLPIADFSVPGEAFEQQWIMQGQEIRSLLRNGEDVLVHCKGGLGRAGMIAARLLVELGMDSKQAIRSVRKARKGAIETSAQLALVHATVAIP
jgi:protein-tyrosine phosphatase